MSVWVLLGHMIDYKKGHQSKSLKRKNYYRRLVATFYEHVLCVADSFKSCVKQQQNRREKALSTRYQKIEVQKYSPETMEIVKRYVRTYVRA